MIFPSPTPFENVRLKALRELDILDTPCEPQYDSITKITAYKLSSPHCFISFVDSDRIWIKSYQGSYIKELPRRKSICGHVINEIKSTHPKDRIYQIYDTKNDTRFFDNSFVLGKPWIRSYICYVLQSKPSNLSIGTISVLDTKPKIFANSEVEFLISMGIETERLINNQPKLN